MSFDVKFVFTLAAVVIGLALVFVNPRANNAGPNWLWRGGERDIVRNVICRRDGSLRRYTKLGLLIWFVLALTAMWLLA